MVDLTLRTLLRELLGRLAEEIGLLRIDWVGTERRGLLASLLILRLLIVLLWLLVVLLGLIFLILRFRLGRFEELSDGARAGLRSAIVLRVFVDFRVFSVLAVVFLTLGEGVVGGWVAHARRGYHDARSCKVVRIMIEMTFEIHLFLRLSLYSVLDIYIMLLKITLRSAFS